METKQVNITRSVDGDVTAWISNWSEDGYVGMLIDTQYVDGADTTDWCVFVGTEEECKKYVEEYNHVDMVEYLASKNNVPASLRAINSAILSGIPIIIGYSSQNLRYGELAENWLHIGGKPVYWPIGYSDPDTVSKELQVHAAHLKKTVKIRFSWTCQQRGQTGSRWWAEGSHLSRFKVETW